MRLSDAQAKALGIVITGSRARVTKPIKAPAIRSAADAKAEMKKATRTGAGDRDPQTMIYNALIERYPGVEAQWEVEGLVPGRKFRADIYIPKSRLLIEMDGFAYHRSKSAFQADRERQNLFVQHGYRLLRYYTSQVFGDLDAVIAQIIETHQFYTGLDHI